MNISLTWVVMFILYLLIAAAVVGLLWWLIGFIGKQFRGEPAQLIVKWARILLIVLLVVVAIFFLLSLMGGPQIHVGP